MPLVNNYKDCEDATATLMRTLSTYFPEAWMISDDDAVLTPSGKGTKGLADYLVVYHPGNFSMQAMGNDSKLRLYTWSIVCDLFVKWYDYKRTWDRYKLVRAELVELFAINPSLNGTHGVRNADMVSGGNPLYFFKTSDDDPLKPPDFITQTLVVNVPQVVEYNGGER